MESLESRIKSHWKEYNDHSPVEYLTSDTSTTGGGDYVNLTFTHWKGVEKVSYTIHLQNIDWEISKQFEYTVHYQSATGSGFPH